MHIYINIVWRKTGELVAKSSWLEQHIIKKAHRYHPGVREKNPSHYGKRPAFAPL